MCSIPEVNVFGIVMYLRAIKELKKVQLAIVIVFLGAKPYPTMGNVLEIQDFLNNGRRLTKPDGCLPEM